VGPTVVSAVLLRALSADGIGVTAWLARYLSCIRMLCSVLLGSLLSSCWVLWLLLLLVCGGLLVLPLSVGSVSWLVFLHVMSVV
jgi:hypothetical protein